jgi:hypothetical protein
MITDNDIKYVYDPESLRGAPLTFVIDGNCLYDFTVSEYGFDLFTKNKGISDISIEYPEHDGTTVKIIKENDEIEIYQTNEYFGSILLSGPTVVNLLDYPYGHHVTSPDASFDGEKFIIKNRTVSQHFLLTEWHPKNPNNPNYIAP